MANGTVKVVTDKGYGFISSDEYEKDVFYHENNLEGDLAVSKLKVGDKVTFEVEETPKGLNAVKIQVVTE